MKICSLVKFSFRRLLAAQFVDAKYKLLNISIDFLLNSSGKGENKLWVLSPASI